MKKIDQKKGQQGGKDLHKTDFLVKKEVNPGTGHGELGREK